jgi:integrase/recombinase XerD
LTPAQFSELAEVPPEIEWLGNITNKKTQRACKIDVQGFVRLSHASILRKLSALSSLFDYLCERNAVAGNPVKGSSGQRPIIMWAALRPWAMRRRGVYWRPPPDTLNGVSRHFVFGIGGRRSGVNGLQL